MSLNEDTKKFIKEVISGMEWTSDRPERRKSVSSDHDLLTRIDEKLSGVVELMKDYSEEFEQHKRDDNTAFKTIGEKQNQIEMKMAFYAGAIVVVVFIFNMWVKLIPNKAN